MARVVGEPHRLLRQLQDLGIVGRDTLEPFGSRTRDRADIGAVRCRRTGVIVLDSVDHVDGYYEAKQHPELHALGDRTAVVAAHRADTERRVETIAHLVTNRDWLDVGAGSGAMVEAAGDLARTASAVEPQPEFHALLRAAGVAVHADITELGDRSADLVTLFHVLEHIADPLGHLEQVRRVLRREGTVVIEVPHARDLLLDFLALESFRDFTLWSEHLVLHTRESLRVLLTAAGFDFITVSALQRYPLANHLHWLAAGRPGGHERWSMLRSADLDEAYASMLARLDATDTLLAIARPG
jgi:ubiquinone/menaquinone biosynthesis C-methylase UbiE